MNTALFAILSLASSAHAQQPITLNLGAETELKTMFIVEDTPSKRFVDAEQPGKAFIAGDQVQVLAEEQGLVRIMKGNTFGWVASSVLSDEAPAPAEAPTPPAIPVEGSN